MSPDDEQSGEPCKQASRGALIVLEGVDRTGKSTQCAKLVEYLQSTGHPAELWAFPDRTTTIGTVINRYLSNTITTTTDVGDGCIHLLFSANRWEKRDKMIETLARGITLVVDRYAFSGVAYTVAKGAPGLNREWCMAPDAGLVAPDAVFFLELNADTARERGGFGEERYEVPAFQQAVMAEFHHMKDMFPSIWYTIDVSGSIDEVHDTLKERVDSVLERERGPLRILWDGTPAPSDVPSDAPSDVPSSV